MSQILLSLSLIGTLLLGQTFCCCTAKAAAAHAEHSSEKAPACCSSKGNPCQPSTPDSCPCKHKQRLADVGVSTTIDVAPHLLQHDWLLLSAMLPVDVVRGLPAVDRIDRQRRVRWAMPRADRVALSQMLLC